MPDQQESASAHRQSLIVDLERARNSRIITYILSDRQGVRGQVAEDAVRPMYDHLKSIGKVPRIDLFLYSVGGLTDVPWRIVSMLREFGDRLGVIVPYKAMSAATMIAIGADEIVMGPKGELGPIDPQMSIQRGGDGGTAVQEQIAVEDIMSYVQFLKDKVGLSDQAALAGPISAMAAKMDPWMLGQINRAHSHIRSVARKLLASRHVDHTLEEAQIETIIDTLAEKTFQHGHAIGRHEARAMGLNVVDADHVLEAATWNLFEAYETLCALRDPIDPRSFIPPGQEERSMYVVMGAMESKAIAFEFGAEMKGRNQRQPVPQLNLNLNLNLNLPPSVNAQQLPAALQQAIQQSLQQLQQNATVLIQQALQQQMPLVGIEAWTQDGAWRPVGDWPKAAAETPGT